MAGLSLVLLLLLTASRLLDAPPRRRTSSSSRLSAFAISTPKVTYKTVNYPDDGDSTTTIVERKEMHRALEKDPSWPRESAEKQEQECNRDVPVPFSWGPKLDNGPYMSRKHH